MKVDLKPQERLDDLVFNGMKLIQRADQFCFSLDTVLLAHWGEITRGKILDLGTGTAAIPLILQARGATAVTGVECNPVMADIARRNVALNNAEKSVCIKETDYRQIREWAHSGAFTAIYANPPYRLRGHGGESPVLGIRRACHEETATLDDVLAAASYALKYHGRFRMVHIAERLADIISAMRRYDIEPKTLRFVHGKPDKPAKLFLVEGVRGGHMGLTVLPPLIVHHADGTYTQDLLALYGK